MTNLNRWTFGTQLCALLALFACDNTLRGGAGESCTSRNDCQGGLLCVERVCVAAPDGEEPGSPQGESCTARRDCQQGLTCMDSVCTAGPLGEETDNRYSGRGESCRAKNDCLPELACVGGTCRDVTLALETTGRECVLVECAQDADCCQDFQRNDNCDAYEANCEMDPIFCNTFRSLCQCNLMCEQELCVASAPGCGSDAECMSQQTPFCVDSRCRQCAKDNDCPGTGTRCQEGVCTAPCKQDESCPPLHECQDGRCVEVGCVTDRECVFLTGDPLSVCAEDGCLVPCDQDTDCASDTQQFHVCEDGQCVFVGCETDAECRALLGLSNLGERRSAECR